jgi:hypothetical protein
MKFMTQKSIFRALDFNYFDTFIQYKMNGQAGEFFHGLALQGILKDETNEWTYRTRKYGNKRAATLTETIQTFALNGT